MAHGDDMISTIANFTFAESVPMHEVEATLRLARLAVQSVHGEDRVRLEARLDLDHSARTCRIDASTRTGRMLALVFSGYVRREFGEGMVGFEWEANIAKVAAGGPA